MKSEPRKRSTGHRNNLETPCSPTRNEALRMVASPWSSPTTGVYRSLRSWLKNLGKYWASTTRYGKTSWRNRSSVTGGTETYGIYLGRPASAGTKSWYAKRGMSGVVPHVEHALTRNAVGTWYRRNTSQIEQEANGLTSNKN